LGAAGSGPRNSQNAKEPRALFARPPQHQFAYQPVGAVHCTGAAVGRRRQHGDVFDSKMSRAKILQQLIINFRVHKTHNAEHAKHYVQHAKNAKNLSPGFFIMLVSFRVQVNLIKT
jgi:hypothetical protein